MDLEEMNVPDSISYDNRSAITRHGNRHGRIFQRCCCSADLLLEAPEPEGAVGCGREGVSTIGGNRDCRHIIMVAGKNVAQLRS